MLFISRSLFTAGLLALISVSAHAKIERVVEKMLSVQPGGLLKVETSGGNIRVLAGGVGAVKVVATQQIRTGSESEADELLKKLDLVIAQDAEGVTATAKYEKLGGWSWGRQPVQVDFTVTVPVNFRANLKTSGGNVSLDELNGKLHVRTSGGNIALGKIGGDIDAGTSGGDVKLGEGLAVVKLSTSGGNIRVDRAVGPTDLDTSGGDIVVSSVENTLRADTSGGNVTATIVGALKGDCKLGTSGGDVRVTIDRSVALDLDAATSGGEVEANGITITIEKGGVGRSKLAGQVNGGGPLLKLRTSGGDIVIKQH